jgi:hypothetical protein
MRFSLEDRKRRTDAAPGPDRRPSVVRRIEAVVLSGRLPSKPREISDIRSLARPRVGGTGGTSSASGGGIGTGSKCTTCHGDSVTNNPAPPADTEGNAGA